MRAIQICPLCRGDIATNVHPLEPRVTLFMSIVLTVGLALFGTNPGPMTGALAGAVVVALIGAAVYLQAKTRDWQRYKRYAPEPDPGNKL